MLKLIRVLALLSFLSILVVGCASSPSSQVVRSVSDPTPTPTPIVFTAPDIPTPTPIPQATPSCFLGIFACSTPTPVPCQPHYIYDNLINIGTSWIVVNQQQDQNNTTSPIQVTFTSTTSRTITVTDKLGLTQTSTSSEEVSGEAIQDTITNSVAVAINHSVSRSVTATIGNGTVITIPAGKTAYGNYGVRVQVTDGRLYDQADCEGENSYFGPDITYVPVATGWCVWISGQPSCPSVQL